MGYEGCWCVYYLGSHRCLGRHLGVEGVEGVAGNVYRNRKAVFCAVDRTMRMCLSANRLLGLGENARREVKRSKQTSLAVATCDRSISMSYGIFGMRVWIERTPDLLSNLAAGLEMGSGKLWREAGTITRRCNILVRAPEHLHIFLRLTAVVGTYFKPIEVRMRFLVLVAVFRWVFRCQP